MENNSNGVISNKRKLDNLKTQLALATKPFEQRKLRAQIAKLEGIIKTQIEDIEKIKESVESSEESYKIEYEGTFSSTEDIADWSVPITDLDKLSGISRNE